METRESILSAHVPSASLSYCVALWTRYGFDFHLRKSRVSKAGDFTLRKNRPPMITLNRDLDPLLFLITYLHEVAHHEVHVAFGTKADPHGREWKRAFQQLMLPVMTDAVFPAALLPFLREHMSDPMASNYSDPRLMRELRKYDPRAKMQVLLSELPEGSLFVLRGKYFRKGKTNRTRALCYELKTRRKYLVPIDAPVGNAQLVMEFKS